MNELTDRDESGLGWVYPPQPQQTFIEEIIGIVSGTTELVEGQDYIDVVFGSAQPSVDWVLIETSIFNTADDAPLNVWPGVVTSKTTAGFRLQLNGTPESGNYFLNWSIRGVFGYYLSGPVSGRRNVASSPFTVRLPDESTLIGTVIITPSDGGVGGIFTPATVALTVAAPVATFTYTPSSYGPRSIGTDNDRGLIDPAQIGFTSIASEYTLSGPSSGQAGVPSTNFTVALPVGGSVIGSVTVTPDDGGSGGAFTPATVVLTTAAPSMTFTYTAASDGVYTIDVTNDGGLTDPGGITYTASLGDGSPISTWVDSSANGHDATQTGSARPTFRTNIVNGKPIVRFAAANSASLDVTSPISGAAPWTSFIVMKPLTNTVACVGLNETDQSIYPIIAASDGFLYAANRNNYASLNTNIYYTAFHVFSVKANGTGVPIAYADGNVITPLGSGPNVFPSSNFSAISYALASGDIAEIVHYNADLNDTDRSNIEKYLGDKYGITVAGGSAVQPDTVTGLEAWWKADSL